MNDDEIFMIVPAASRLIGGILAVVELDKNSVLQVDDNGVVIAVSQCGAGEHEN
jgi:hypothetical protein